MMWVMIYTTLFRYIGDGPEWNGPYDQAQCLNNGWLYNLLYITNFVDQDGMVNKTKTYFYSILLLPAVGTGLYFH